MTGSSETGYKIAYVVPFGRLGELMKISPEALIRPAPGAVSRVGAEEALVLDLSSDRFFRLDAVGTRVWSLIAGGVTLQEIVTVLVAEFDVEANRVREDTERLIEELVTLGLARIGDGRG